VLNVEKCMHGTAGDTNDGATRQSGAAKSRNILIDPETYFRSEGYFRIESGELQSFSS
jgi:hypothetical protein